MRIVLKSIKIYKNLTKIKLNAIIKSRYIHKFSKPTRRRKKSGAARKQAGKKKKGCGENEFLPACQSAESGQWGGSVSAIPASAGRQNRKIFVSLIEKSFGGRAKLKIVEKMFLLGLRAKRAAAERSVKIRNPDFRQKKFGFRPTNTTLLKICLNH